MHQVPAAFRYVQVKPLGTESQLELLPPVMSTFVKVHVEALVVGVATKM